MKDSTINKVQKLPPLPSEMAQDVREFGTITGSKVFGGFQAGVSDIDVILPPAKLGWGFNEVMTERCGWYEHREYDDPEYEAVYVKVPYSKHPHNLLFMRDARSYQRWVNATIWMKRMKDNCPSMREFFKRKEKRIEMFEMLKTWELSV